MLSLGTGLARSSAPADAFFARWADRATWPEWSPDAEWVRVDGDVREGPQGRLKPKGGPRVRFVVTVCEPSREFTDTSHLRGARLVFRHAAEPTAAGTDLRVTVAISGPLAQVWAVTIGCGFRTSAQADRDWLVRRVEAVA